MHSGYVCIGCTVLEISNRWITKSSNWENFLKNAKREKSFIHIFVFKVTHGNNNLPIPTIGYFINTLDGQSTGRGRGGQHSFFIKLLTITKLIFRKMELSKKLSDFDLIFCVAHVTGITGIHVMMMHLNKNPFDWHYLQAGVWRYSRIQFYWLFMTSEGEHPYICGPSTNDM